jgi:CheY-like chemotaxis protein
LSLLTPPAWGAAIDVYWGLGVSQHGPATQGKRVPRILVADDNTNIQKMVVLAFQERGIEVIAVGNGEAAVRRIPDANPDLVLADVFMPVRNGYEVCEFVKKDARFSHIPVILLVGAFDPLDEKEARRVGADGVLKKPFVPPDPLIAMVMSALEKNPRVIAELARTKEAKEAAAAITALPAAAMENPAMAEVKPLPEFPEPSPEEAAMIYGFGKGVRAIDSDETEEDEDEADTKKSKSSQTLKDPQAAQKKSKTPAVAAPKTPVVAMEEDDEEVFDESVTASDWRRNAADFEVPDNVEANPIYSYGKNFEPITFPSERDVPPKHVRPDETAQGDGSAQEVSRVTPIEASSTASSAEPPAVATEAASNWELTTNDELETQQTEIAKVDTASPLASASVEDVSSSPIADHHANEIHAVESVAPIASASEAVAPNNSEAARPSFVARVRGWMDMMSPSSDEPAETTTESRDQHWMTSLASPSATSSADGAAPRNASEIENPVKLAEAESLAENAEAPALVETTAIANAEPPIHEVRAEAAPEEQFEPTAMANLENLHSEASQFNESEPYSISDHDAHSEAAAISQEPAYEEIHASADEDALPVISVEAPSEHLQESAQGSWTDSLQVSDARRNGDAAAGHLPLEPMISDLHEQPAVTAAEPEQEPAHVAEWLRHRANQSEVNQTGLKQAELVAAESLPAESSEPEPAGHMWAEDHQEPVYDEKPFADQPESSIFDHEPSEAFAQQFAERIPTLPPPNREALSQIPFLIPNAEREPATSERMNASNSATIDEVVRRVLEKLQPQLHELLAQGVKPLVENLLQNELKSELHKNQK